MNPTDFGSQRDPERAAQHHASRAKEWVERREAADPRLPLQIPRALDTSLVAIVEALLAIEARLQAIDDRIRKALDQRH